MYPRSIGQYPGSILYPSSIRYRYGSKAKYPRFIDAKCKFIAQCFVYGDSFNSSLVAIIAVEPEVLKAWAASEGIHYEDLRRLCADPRARAAVLADMDSIGKEAQLRGFEFVKAVTLVAEPFTLENGLLTPTFKVKRPQAKAYFAKEITDMYAQLNEAEAARPRL